MYRTKIVFIIIIFAYTFFNTILGLEELSLKNNDESVVIAMIASWIFAIIIGLIYCAIGYLGGI